MKYRLSMFWWKLRCAWCDVKIAFGYLFNSKVRHPLLLEAVLRFQANARSELLPTDGPVNSKGAPELNIPRPVE